MREHLSISTTKCPPLLIYTKGARKTEDASENVVWKGEVNNRTRTITLSFALSLSHSKRHLITLAADALSRITRVGRFWHQNMCRRTPPWPITLKHCFSWPWACAIFSSILSHFLKISPWQKCRHSTHWFSWPWGTRELLTIDNMPIDSMKSWTFFHSKYFDALFPGMCPAWF
jgi:hypothetical protein